MKKLKILMLHLGYGGVEKQTILMANALAKKYEIEIVSFYKYLDVPYQINNQIKVKYLTDFIPTRELFWQNLKQLKLIKTFKIGLKSLKILSLKKKLIKKEILLDDADIYLATRIEYGAILSKYGSCQKIKVAQEHNYIDNPKYLQKLSQNLKQLDYLVVISKWHEKVYNEYFYKTKVKIVRIPNILDYQTKFEEKKLTNNLIAIGRLDKVKDFLNLIEVGKFLKLKIPNYSLYIIGDGEEKNKIIAKIKEYHLEKNIILTGFLKPNQIVPYLKKANLYLMTSTKECFPLVILEAFAYSIPVISYDILSGPHELIKNKENGFLINKRDPLKMANKIFEVLNDSKNYMQLQKNAFTESNKYLAKNIIYKWEDIFQ